MTGESAGVSDETNDVSSEADDASGETGGASGESAADETSAWDADPALESWTVDPAVIDPSAFETHPRRLLVEAVAIPSVSGSEAAVREHLAAFFRAHGRAPWTDAVGNLRVPGEGDLLATGHLDTVPGEIPVRIERTDEPAFGGAPTIEPTGDDSEAEPTADDSAGGPASDDATGVPELQGRGSVDATGAAVAAAVAAVATGCPFAGVVREETDSAGARHLVTDRSAPEAVVNGEPSGWDAVTLAYRGLVRVTYRVATPATHGARPESNAIQLATAWWNRVSEAFDADGPVVERVTATPTAFTGGPSEDGLATEATVEASFRVPLGREPASVRETVAENTDAGELSWEASIPPVETSRRGPTPRAFRAAIRATGGQPRALRKTGTADTNHYAAGWDCPVVTYGPGDSGLDHTPDERLPLPAFDRAVAVLTRALDRLR